MAPTVGVLRRWREPLAVGLEVVAALLLLGTGRPKQQHRLQRTRTPRLLLLVLGRATQQLDPRFLFIRMLARGVLPRSLHSQPRLAVEASTRLGCMLGRLCMLIEMGATTTAMLL